MPDPTSKPPSLVEVLRELASNYERRADECSGTHDEPIHRGSQYAYSDAAKIAAPYAKRLDALELVAAAVKRCLDEDGEMREDCGLEPVAYLKRIFRALAAVPEIKETPTDGS